MGCDAEKKKIGLKMLCRNKTNDIARVIFNLLKGVLCNLIGPYSLEELNDGELSVGVGFGGNSRGPF
jgi:hypothetical protein